MTRPLGWWGPVRREAARRGRIADPSFGALAGQEPERVRRGIFRRVWTPEEAQSWSREDAVAIVLSPFVFAGIMFGLTRLLLWQLSGLFMLAGAAAGWAVIYRLIDPKLRAV